MFVQHIWYKKRLKMKHASEQRFSCSKKAKHYKIQLKQFWCERNKPQKGKQKSTKILKGRIRNSDKTSIYKLVQMRHPYIRANSLLLSVSVRYTSSIKAKLNSYSRTKKNDQTSPQNLFVYLKRTDVYMLLDIPSQIFIDSTVCWSKAKKKSDIINV